MCEYHVNRVTCPCLNWACQKKAADAKEDYSIAKDQYLHFVKYEPHDNVDHPGGWKKCKEWEEKYPGTPAGYRCENAPDKGRFTIGTVVLGPLCEDCLHCVQE